MRMCVRVVVVRMVGEVVEVQVQLGHLNTGEKRAAFVSGACGVPEGRARDGGEGGGRVGGVGRIMIVRSAGRTAVEQAGERGERGAGSRHAGPAAGEAGGSVWRRRSSI